MMQEKLLFYNKKDVKSTFLYTFLENSPEFIFFEEINKNM